MDESAGGGAKARKERAPPYVSFKTFRTFMQDVHEHGVPGRIDYSVLSRFSGTVRVQLLSALRSLSLVGPDDKPTDRLHELKDAFGTEEWAPKFAEVLKDTYAPVMAIGLGHATPSQLNEAFRSYPLESEEVRRRCIVFFLQAAQDASLPVSKRILDTLRRGSGAAPRRPRLDNGSGARDRAAGANHPPPPPPPPPPADRQNGASQSANPYRAAYEALSAVWRPGEMEEEIDAAVVTLLRYLRRKETEGQA